MSNIFKIFQDLISGQMFTNSGKVVYSVGPNNLNELLKQFDQPTKPKTAQQVVMDTFYKEKFTELEIDFLKNSPDVAFHGSFKTFNNDDTIDIDFVPCSVRPEVLYCCYGKN
jgi:hypothetical protein